MLSICGAGDNVLALLLSEPRSIVAVDVSPAQTALLELKLAALRRLTHVEFVGLLGARPLAGRWELYARVRADLPASARAFWDGNEAALRFGVIDVGLAERYLDRFRRRQIGRIDPAAITRLLDLDDREEQTELWVRCFGTPEFEAAFRRHAAPEAVSGNGRDATTFRYAQVEDVPALLLSRMCHVCTQIPTRGNFYLERRLTGRYRDLASGPPFLRPANFERLRTLADRVRVRTGSLEAVLQDTPPESFSAANLSNIFEYMSEESTGDLLELIASRVRAAARLAYWNTLVQRSRPERLAGVLAPRHAEARELWWRDRAAYYRDFHLEERI